MRILKDMKTELCVPGTDFIPLIIDEFNNVGAGKKGLAATGGFNRKSLENWEKKPSSIKMESLVKLVNTARKLGSRVVHEWEQTVLAEEKPVTIIATVEFYGSVICERQLHPKPGAMVVWNGELGYWKPSVDGQAHHFESLRYPHVFRVMTKPRYVVIGKVEPLNTKDYVEKVKAGVNNV